MTPSFPAEKSTNHKPSTGTNLQLTGTLPAGQTPFSKTETQTWPAYCVWVVMSCRLVLQRAGQCFASYFSQDGCAGCPHT